VASESLSGLVPIVSDIRTVLIESLTGIENISSPIPDILHNCIVDGVTGASQVSVLIPAKIVAGTGAIITMSEALGQTVTALIPTLTNDYLIECVGASFEGLSSLPASIITTSSVDIMPENIAEFNDTGLTPEVFYDYTIVLPPMNEGLVGNKPILSLGTTIGASNGVSNESFLNPVLNVVYNNIVMPGNADLQVRCIEPSLSLGLKISVDSGDTLLSFNEIQIISDQHITSQIMTESINGLQPVLHLDSKLSIPAINESLSGIVPDLYTVYNQLFSVETVGNSLLSGSTPQIKLGIVISTLTPLLDVLGLESEIIHIYNLYLDVTSCVEELTAPISNIVAVYPILVPLDMYINLETNTDTEKIFDVYIDMEEVF